MSRSKKSMKNKNKKSNLKDWYLVHPGKGALAALTN